MDEQEKAAWDESYEAAKETLNSGTLSPEEYEQACKVIAEEYGI